MRIRELLTRLRDRTRRDQLDGEIDDELRFHQSMLERDRLAQGIPAPDARKQSAIMLGNRATLKEDTRATWGFGIVEDLLQDMRYASRVLRHNMVFASAVVLTLALGIGANTAIFSVVNAVILRPLPYDKPDELYTVWTVPVGAPADRRPTSYPELNDWKQRATSFTALAAYTYNRFELHGNGEVDMARGVVGTSGLYEILAATPMLGRLPRADEAEATVVTISHRLWQRHFAGDSSAIGTSIVLNEVAYTLVGVMPPGFQFPTPDVDLWLSFAPILQTGAASDNPWIVDRGYRGYRTVGRLREGITPVVAEREMNEIMDQLGEEFPSNAAGTDIRLQSIRDEASVRDVKRALWLMLGAAGLVLLLACANVAHLMLARVSTRVREIAIRRALGAHRGRVVRQLLTESLVLGLIGGAAGLAVAVGGVRLFVLLSPADIPRVDTIAIDGTTIAFAVALSIVTAAIFGVAPAIVAWRSGVDAAMREQGRSTTSAHTGRMRSVLTAAEVAFALVLLVGAGLMMRSFTGMLTADPGFRTDHAFTFQIALPLSRYPLPQDRALGAQRVVEAIGRIPGVQSVGAGTSMPPSRMQQGQSYSIVGEPRPERGREPVATYVTNTADFHRALGIPLVAGRLFTQADDDVTRAGRVVIINEELARRHFQSRDPVGQRLLLGGDSTWRIVGVVRDVPYEGLAIDVKPTIYVPWGQHSFAGAFVIVRTTSDMQAVMNAVGDVLHGVDAKMNARELRPMADVVSENMVRPRFQTWLLGSFGALALALAAIGIYGVIAYGVAQRASEIGLRLAIGAPESSVIRMLLRRTMVPVVAGLVIGVAGALAASRVMQSMLVDVSSTDLPTFVAMTALLATVAMVAAFIPTVRATRGNPTAALRGD